MGQVYSEIPPVCIPTSEKSNEGESRIFRNIECTISNGGDLIETYRCFPDAHTLIDLMRLCSVRYADKDSAGERVINPDGSAGPYKFLTYKQFYENQLAFGRGLLELGLQRGDRIGIYSSNSVMWQTAAFGAYSVGMVVVPVYDSLGKDAAQYIINHAEVKLLLASPFKWEAAQNVLKETPTVNYLVYSGDKMPQTDIGSIKVLTANEILENGRNSSQPNKFSDTEDTAVIMYTSGSTGVPKGCVLTHHNIVAGSSAFASVHVSVSPNDTFLSFLPLAHIYAMAVEMVVYVQGSKVGYARGPINCLIDDIQALRPSIIIAVPRVVNRIAETMKAKIAAKPAFVQKLIRKCMQLKTEAIRNNKPNSALLDYLILNKFADALGGRVRILISGGAPILPDICDFICSAVTPNVVQGYGLTECCAGLAVQAMPVDDVTTVGAPTLGVDIKLRPVPGTDYNPTAEVEPTGELMVRGPGVFKEYYKQPELTEEVKVDGWFATGDVVCITKGGQIRIIDRAKQLVKLSQGEYLSLTMMMDAYAMAEGVSFIYVYADSRHNQCIAVVVPKKENQDKWKAAGISDIKNDPKVHKEILDSLIKLHNDRGLRGFEKIKYFIVETEEPTIENGLLTPSMKPQLTSLKKKYETELQKLYLQVEAEDGSSNKTL